MPQTIKIKTNGFLPQRRGGAENFNFLYFLIMGLFMIFSASQRFCDERL
jgi:hypothetical protein